MSNCNYCKYLSFFLLTSSTIFILQAVDLRSYQFFSPPSVKVRGRYRLTIGFFEYFNFVNYSQHHPSYINLQQAYNYGELYQAALAEILEVLATVCKAHRLPLALTWAPCLQQGKDGCRQSDENYAHCLSTVDTACFVSDAEVLGFHEACSEYHLFRGQGTVGTAFTTTKPCFATDMTAFSKTEYPLSHHARMFGLRAAVAIPFRSLYTGSADFLLEFFLPKDCHDTEEQKQMLNSLSIVLKQACRNLHAVIEKELDEVEVIYSVEEVVIASDVGIKKEEPQKSVSSPLKEACSKESSWIARMTEVQHKGKGVSISWEYQEEDPKEAFKVTTHWDNTQGASLNGQGLSEFGQLQKSSGSKGSVDGGGGSYSYGGQRSSGRKTGEKKRTKTEKTIINLSVLRQYFAGSLKDAAKSIGGRKISITSKVRSTSFISNLDDVIHGTEIT